jgi:phage major head subunit gpT-like protein
MNRRSFMQALLAASVAPYVVRSGILMPVRTIITADNVTWDSVNPKFIVVPSDIEHALSERALEDAIIAIRSMTDDRGFRLNVTPTRAMMPPHLRPLWDQYACTELFRFG